MLLKAAYAGKSILFLYNAIIEDAPASNVIRSHLKIKILVRNQGGAEF